PTTFDTDDLGNRYMECRRGTAASGCGAFGFAGEVRRRRVSGTRTIRAEQRHQLLEVQTELLWCREGQYRKLGIREREVLGDPGSQVRTERIVQAAADTGTKREGTQAAIRHTEPRDVLDRRAFAGEPRTDERAHVVFADHSEDGGSDLRGESHILEG